MSAPLHRLAALAVVVAALAVPAAAHADAYDEVFGDYTADGRIDACAHTAEELRDARRQTPSDIEAYAPDFSAALEAAADARGSCGAATTAAGAAGAGAAPGAPAATGTPAPAPAPGTTAPAPGVPGAPADGTAPGGTPGPGGTARTAGPAGDGAVVRAARTSTEDAGAAALPAPVLVLAVLAALLALAALVAGLARLLAVEPRWALAARHAIAEAGWRAGGTAADFGDWLRSRRRPAG